MYESPFEQACPENVQQTKTQIEDKHELHTCSPICAAQTYFVFKMNECRALPVKYDAHRGKNYA